MSDDVDKLVAALAAPFDPGEVKHKAQAVSGNRALAVPYVDARVVMDRLDDVLGVAGWQDTYEMLPDGSVVCRLKVRLGGEWITKEDVGGPSEQPDEGDRHKAAFSDALKRTAVKLGVGRYLYRLKAQWVDYDPQKKQIVRPPQLPAAPAKAQPRQAAGWAGASTQAPAKPASGEQPAGVTALKTGEEVRQRTIEYEDKLVKAGLCEKEELIVALEEALGDAWNMHPPEQIAAWCKDKAAQWKKAMAQTAG